MIPSVIVSVDPGVHSAWAHWVSGDSGWTLRRYGRLRRPTILRALELLRSILPADGAGTLVAIEGQWYQHRGAPWRSIQVLTESRCWWQGAALVLGAEVRIVPPRDWMPAVSRGAQGATAGERVRAVCRLWHPELRTLSLDEAAAIMLGRYVISSKKGEKS